MSTLITVAIPAYNRPDDLAVLLPTILSQRFDNFDLLVVEDKSPKQAEIRAVVETAIRERTDIRIRYFSNERNLGFDGNIRRILELSDGEFTMFMGDDDLMKPGALEKIGKAITRHPNLGVVLRAYEEVDYTTGAQREVFRYFPEDRFFPAGAPTMRTFFRRCVSIAGFTIHTQSARAFSTNQFDGTLLYQLYLGTRVVQKRDGFFIADILTSMRKDDRQRHFFGSAESEKGLFAPGELTPGQSIQFMRGMVNIVKTIEEATHANVQDGILDDLSNFAYPYLRLHTKNRRAFLDYVQSLRQLGLARTPLFWLFTTALLTVPTPWLDEGIRAAKRILKSTPRLGGLYSGERPTVR